MLNKMRECRRINWLRSLYANLRLRSHKIFLLEDFNNHIEAGCGKCQIEQCYECINDPIRFNLLFHRDILL